MIKKIVAFGKNHPRVVLCLNDVVNVYRNKKKYSKASIILQRHLPVDHSNLDSSYSTIDNIHLSSFSHHDQALQSFCQKSLSFQHRDIPMMLNNIDIV